MKGQEMSFKGIFGKVWETDDEATERLARSPEGSINHELSQLPPRESGPYNGAFYLPRTCLVVVVDPRLHKPTTEWKENGKIVRDITYRGKVIWSGNPSYPVGGHDIVVSEQEMVRSIRLDLGLAVEQAIAEVQGGDS